MARLSDEAEFSYTLGLYTRVGDGNEVGWRCFGCCDGYSTNFYVGYCNRRNAEYSVRIRCPRTFPKVFANADVFTFNVPS
jgi:hypothetical protein